MEKTTVVWQVVWPSHRFRLLSLGLFFFSNHDCALLLIRCVCAGREPNVQEKAEELLEEYQLKFKSVGSAPSFVSSPQIHVLSVCYLTPLLVL